MAAGPELPSDQDESLIDDEDGRFFGGGITKDTAEVLDFIDGRDKDDVMVSRSTFPGSLLIANTGSPDTRENRFGLAAKAGVEL